jgi:hypothetical protein
LNRLGKQCARIAVRTLIIVGRILNFTSWHDGDFIAMSNPPAIRAQRVA